MRGFFESKVNLVNTFFKNVFWYITQKIYERDILENPWMVVFVPDEYKTRKMCERAVDGYPWVLRFVPMELITQEMCKMAAGKNPLSEKTH